MTYDTHNAPAPRPRSGNGLTGSLTQRVLGWLLLISLAPLVVMAAQGYHCASQAVTEKTENHIHAVLQARHALLDHWLLERRNELELLAAAPVMRQVCGHEGDPPGDAVRAEIAGMLNAVDRDGSAHLALAVYGAGGERMARSSGTAADPREWFERPAGLGGPPGHVYRGLTRQLDGQTGLGLARPIFAEDGHHVGTIVAVANVTGSLEPLLQARAGMGDTGRAYLVSPDFETLTAPFAGTQTQTAGREALETLRASPGQVMEYEAPNGGRVLGAAIADPSTEWMLTVEMDHGEAMAWLSILAWRAALTGAATLAVLILAALLVSDRLGQPLRELTRVARLIQGGRSGERVGPMAGGDAEEVRHAFNSMLDELQRKQEELVQTATLASIGELSSSIVHEMRNPLSSIKMNMQALDRAVRDDAALNELAGITRGQVHRLEAMLDDLLQYGRPVEIQREPASFAALAEDVLHQVAGAMEERNVRVEVDNGLNGAELWVDREQVCRALTNVVLNAVQATPEGGQVWLCARPESSGVLLEVRDTGPGFGDEARRRLFKPFFTTKPNGTGLGLANVRKIAELHGGRVEARNAPDGGAAVSLLLPAAEASGAAA